MDGVDGVDGGVAASRDGDFTGRAVLVVFVVIGMVFGGLFVPIESAGAANLDVCPSGCTYSTVSDAVAAASAGDMISVGAGTYVENLTVSTDVTIVGVGSAQTIIDGGAAGRAVFVASGATVTITDLEISNGLVTASGSPSPNGGGIYNEGNLSLERVRVVGNTVADGGAGIYNLGSLTVTDSTISRNTGMTDGTGSIGGGGIASSGPSTTVTVSGSSITDNELVTPGTDDRGGGGISVKFGDLTVSDSEVSNNSSGYSAGGIFVSGSGATFTLTRSTVSGNRTGTDPDRATGRGGGVDLRNSASTTITESTIFGNVSASGGGGLHIDAPTTIVNSTLSGNQAATAGGGILTDVTVSLSSVTITGNAADTFGGGIYGFGDTILTSNSIIANNTAVDAGPDCYTTISVDDVSLVETADGTICQTAGTGTVVTGVDPQVGPLQDNGGSTLTHLPADTSPVVDAGATTLAVDQRGEPRPSGAAPDLGSVEIQAAPQGVIELLPNWGAIGAWTVVRSHPIAGNGCGWAPGETVDIRWDETDLASLTTDTDGCFEEMISLSTERLAGSVPGPHKVGAEGTLSGAAAQAAFEQVTFELFVQPVVGGSGTPVTFSGCGWDGASTVNVYWLDTGDLVGKSNVDGSGCVDGAGDIPAAPDGYYALGATVDETAPGGPPDTSATAFQVAPAAFTIFPDQGPAGFTVTLTSSSSWYPGEQVEFVWETTGELLATFNVGSNGQITRTANAGGDLVFQIPHTATLGSHDILARGLTSRQTIRQPFQVIDAGLAFDPPEAEPGAVVTASGCGWDGNDTVTLEWGAVDPNGNNPSWLADVDFITGCFGEDGSFTFAIPDDTQAGAITVTATGNNTGQATAVFTVIHGGSILINGGGFGCCNVGPGGTFEIEVTGAIVGELVEFHFDDRPASEGGPVYLTGVGATTPDFTVTATVPLDARHGSTEVSATGTKGFRATDTVFVRDGFIVVDTTRPIYPGTVITVEGSGFGSGEVVDLELRSLDAFGRWDLGQVTVADGATTFEAEIQLPFDLDGGRYEIRADGSYGRFPDREIVLQPLPFFARAAGGSAPVLDGVIAQDEWTLTTPVPLPNGTMTFHSDDNRLHILLDMTGDSGADPIGSGDSFMLVFDTDGDGDIDPGDDLAFTLDGDEMVVDEFTGADSFTRRITHFLTSAYAAGFDCFFSDGSAVLDQSTGAVTCDEHRVWEIGVDLSGIAAEPGDVVRIGVATTSQSPSFDDRLPSTLTSEFRALGAVQLSASQLPQPVPTGGILGVGSDGFEIEVTQAIQDQDNGVRLVARKDTVVRVYPDVDSEALVRVHLYGERNGVKLPGSPLVGLVTVPADIDREELDHTAVFRLPASWVTAGTTELIARIDQLDGSASFAASTAVHFHERGDLTVWVYEVNEGTADAPVLPSDSQISDQELVLEAMFPVADVEFVRRAWDEVPLTWDPSDGDSFDDINDALMDHWTSLEQAAAASSAPADLPDLMYGITASAQAPDADGSCCTIGSSDPVWAGGAGRVASGVTSNSKRANMAHELNHDLDARPSSSATWGKHIGGCGAGEDDPGWPTADTDDWSIGEVGFDTRGPGQTILDETEDFMSYCRQSTDAQQPTQWISPYRWELLFSKFVPDWSTGSATLSVAASLTSEDESGDASVHYLSAVIGRDGSAAIDPVVTFPGTPTDFAESGDYAWVIRDGGEVLYSASFRAGLVSVEGDELDRVRVHHKIPAFAGATEILLVRGAEVLASVAASPTPPIVEVLSPRSGEQWSGSHTIEWRAQDPDGDPLTFALFYSPNGSATWYPLARDLTGASHRIDTDRLPGGSQGKILITASDGFHTGSTMSEGVFSVEGAGVSVRIEQPTGGRVLAPDEPFVARGGAIGTDGQRVTDEHLVWTIDGEAVALGSFAWLVLPEGTHDVGLVAVDSTGARGEDTITVVVAHASPPAVVADPERQTVEHGDGITPVTIVATDPDSQGLTLSGVPKGVDVEGGCEPIDAVGETCTWVLAGKVDDGAGEYEVVVHDGYFEQVAHMVTVLPEQAGVAFHGGNPVAVPVTQSGSDASQPFGLTIRVTETEPDSATSGEPHPGDLALAEPSIRLDPIAGGPEVDPESCEVVRLDGAGYDSELTYRCAFDEVPVGLYSVAARVGGGFFAGGGEDVLSVVDPRLGVTSGSGSFLWPDMDDRTTFAFSMEYNRSGKNVKGALILVRHLGDGEQYSVKSNALYGLSLGGSAALEWASFSGKATYSDPNMEEPEGNHEFVVYVENGVSDRFWVEIRDRDGAVIAAASIPRPGGDHAVNLDTGDIDIR